ncbi:MAG: TIGR00730 family Rossman fold protein [Bacteroidota bacterium]
MKSICVFCGSNTGHDPIYSDLAQQLGHLLVDQNIKLIYGAGKVGLMGIIAEAMLAKGGEVVGVIPGFLKAKEVGHDGLTEMIETDTMHQRKQIMADLSEGFIAMPGGFGTMDELCEILTWAQLGLHQFPIGILNVNGYFDTLIQLFDHMVQEGFVTPVNRQLVIEAASPAELLEKMRNYNPPRAEKWLDRTRT